MSPANSTVAVTPPILIAGNTGSVPDCAAEPLTTGEDTGPNPLAYSTTVSPGLAGVVNPGKRGADPSRLPSASSPATCGPPLNTKNAGANGCASTFTDALATPALVT